MKTLKKFSFLALSFILGLYAIGQEQKVTYVESKDDFANPERGFYVPLDAHAHQFIPLDGERLLRDRIEIKKHGSASYGIYSTLLYRGYVLDTFVNKPLSDAFLMGLENDFAIIRKAGVKIIIRFAYTNKVHSGDCPDKEKICPPYGDASKELMLKHISQLKPLLQQNADVIAVLQEGFIGIWGENYYTDYFGDASGNGLGKITDSSWKDRNDLLSALLDALPTDRMVQVRTPQIKQKFVYGPAAPITSSPLKEQDAYLETSRSRIGFHNDCFLASPDDYGTFYDYSKSSGERQADNQLLRKYFEQDSRYGPVGGETCDDAFSPENDCAPAGHAEAEMSAMHYSFLNTAYNNKVNNDWDSLGCITNIKMKLGYRFVLLNSVFPKEVASGKRLKFAINLVNRGYASPYNARSVILVLRNKKDGKEFFIATNKNVCSWYSGNVTWNESVEIPANVPKGNYDLFLNLPDRYSSLSHRPEYSIRLANENVWEQQTGFNNLHCIVTVI